MSEIADNTKFLHDNIPYTAVLGIEAAAIAPEEVRARLGWEERFCTSGGVLHGGALASLADTTAATCAYLNLPDGASGTATIEFKINFFRAVRGGHVEATARPLHVGKATIVLETDLHDAEGRHVARVTQTQAVIRAS